MHTDLEKDNNSTVCLDISEKSHPFLENKKIKKFCVEKMCENAEKSRIKLLGKKSSRKGNDFLISLPFRRQAHNAETV
jgi:hypothetical protein